jgi:transcriptional regulator with XRE-family HTH domain
MPEQSTHNRPPRQAPLHELIALRKAKFPHLLQRDFADKLGITRLYMSNIERGRRRPSVELALRWLALLAPEARIHMFGSVPVIEAQLALIKRLQQVSPVFEAA